MHGYFPPLLGSYFLSGSSWRTGLDDRQACCRRFELVQNTAQDLLEGIHFRRRTVLLDLLVDALDDDQRPGRFLATGRRQQDRNRPPVFRVNLTFYKSGFLEPIHQPRHRRFVDRDHLPQFRHVSPILLLEKEQDCSLGKSHLSALVCESSVCMIFQGLLGDGKKKIRRSSLPILFPHKGLCLRLVNFISSPFGIPWTLSS